MIFSPSFRRLISIFLLLAATSPGLKAEVPIPELFDERIRCVVAVEFFVETEVDRRPSTVIGLVVNDEGLIMILDGAIPGWLPPENIKDFNIYTVSNRDPVPGTYLGQDSLTGWHFLQADESIVGRVVPFTTFDTTRPRLGEELWGVGVMGKDFEFQPFFLNGRLAVIQQLPQYYGFSVSGVATPGSAVFNRDGVFVGWASNPIPQERVLYLENERYNVGIQTTNESGSFFLAEEVVPYIDRAPETPLGRKNPWLGVFGLQPVDDEVATFLKLENQSAIVVSDILPDSPAEAAGLEPRDIIISIDGEILPKFSPDRVVTGYFERRILSRDPGDPITLGVLRGSERLEITAGLAAQPTTLKEADRRYFSELGITLRELVTFDRISRRMTESDDTGVIANFVRPNSPANTAGLRAGDLIQEIDGDPVLDYEQAVGLMDAIESDPDRTEFVLLVSRNGETSVIRIRKS
ncbi:MAG: signal protein PDZ [Verrucomicrobia bacterium]|nr:MAG: signal protein PDZ [Verrucomicrobiota bacterium]